MPGSRLRLQPAASPAVVERRPIKVHRILLVHRRRPASADSSPGFPRPRVIFTAAKAGRAVGPDDTMDDRASPTVRK